VAELLSLVVMRAPPTIEAMKGVTLFYTNPHSGERLDDENVEYPISDVVRFLSQFTRPGISLITTMPSGLGLDFHSEDDGSIWIEFYGDVLQSTFVDLSTAQKILERAYSSQSLPPVRELFSDLVQSWDY
jgi:hypothetical protein